MMHYLRSALGVLQLTTTVATAQPHWLNEKVSEENRLPYSTCRYTYKVTPET